MRSRLIASSTILALAAAGTFALAPAVASSSGTRASAKPVATHFALQGSGFGTRARGGQVPAGSDSSAFQYIGCTNKAGLDRENHQAEETIPGAGTASQVKTRVWTTTQGDDVSSWARNSIKKLVLADNPLGTVEINGITSVSHAFHDDKGFHSETTASIGSIFFTPAGGQPQEQDIPTPGQPVEIPGVATITVGRSVHKTTGSSAVAASDVVDVDSTMSGTRIRTAHSRAVIQGGIKSGIFAGFASGTQGEGADGNVTSGHSPYLVMPCQGTGGKIRTRTIASATPDDNALAHGLKTTEKSQQTGDSASGFVMAQVAGFSLGGDQLTVDGIIGRANVERNGNKLTKDSKGTTVGTISANGEPQTFPDTDTLEIPGVAKLERNVVKKFKRGIYVIALRVTLLDGSGAVLNLGEAKLKIKPSGN
jgi:hypothetical protein